MKYLPLYFKWLKTKRIPRGGLCGSLQERGQKNHELSIFAEYSHDWDGAYWGYDGDFYNWDEITTTKQREIAFSFTPLRQNIVLFLAAMNNEL